MDGHGAGLRQRSCTRRLAKTTSLRWSDRGQTKNWDGCEGTLGSILVERELIHTAAIEQPIFLNGAIGE